MLLPFQRLVSSIIRTILISIQIPILNNTLDSLETSPRDTTIVIPVVGYSFVANEGYADGEERVPATPVVGNSFVANEGYDTSDEKEETPIVGNSFVANEGYGKLPNSPQMPLCGVRLLISHGRITRREWRIGGCFRSTWRSASLQEGWNILQRKPWRLVTQGLGGGNSILLCLYSSQYPFF